MGTPSNSLQNIYLGTVDVSRNNLITCLNSNDKKLILDQIINQNDETYEIIVFRKPKKQCEVCSFESPNSALMCEMCHMPFDYKSEITSNILASEPNLVLASEQDFVLASEQASEPTLPPGLTISSEQIFQAIQKCKYCTYESTNITDKCEICEAPVSATNDNSGWESIPEKIHKSNTNTTWINLGKSNHSVVSSTDDDTTTSVITEIDRVLQNKSINWKLYMKGWTAENCPFITDTVDDLITHINNAICRARNCGYINHIDGIYQLGKSNTSAMVVFSTEIIANAAIKLDNNMLWNKSYLRLFRPQGYIKESNTSVIEIKMNIVREMEGVKLAPIFNHNEQKKKKIQKKTKPVTSNTNVVNKIEPIKYVLTNDQKVLIESIRSCMDSIDLACLENICSDENQDVTFSYDIVFKICNTFNNLKVFKCEPMHNQFIIKENGENKKSYIIERKPTGNITYYSVKYIKNILKAVNFPESEFCIKNVNVVSKKKEIVKIQSSKEQLDLVASLRATLRRNPLECLTIICCHDGRETSVFFDSLAELCTVLHDYKVIIAEVNKSQIKIKNIGNITQPFCIEKRGKEHILQHAVAEVRRQLNNAYFPVWEFI